jgi:hypothetical protein
MLAERDPSIRGRSAEPNPWHLAGDPFDRRRCDGRRPLAMGHGRRSNAPGKRPRTARPGRQPCWNRRWPREAAVAAFSPCSDSTRRLECPQPRTSLCALTRFGRHGLQILNSRFPALRFVTPLASARGGALPVRCSARASGWGSLSQERTPGLGGRERPPKPWGLPSWQAEPGSLKITRSGHT